MAQKRVLGVFSLAMMNVAVIASLRILPMMAKEGFALIFFFLIAAIAFLIPSALVSAELATGWPKEGGVYVWVSTALGQRWGFLAIWLQWIQNVFWYPIALTFGAASLSYLYDPRLQTDKLYMVLMILGVYWGATFVNLFGLKISSLISSVGVISGTIFPTVLMSILGCIWWFGGHPLQISMSIDTIFPDLTDIRNWVFLAGLVLTFGGMEVSAVNAQEVKNPTYTYPRSILLSLIIVMSIFIFGSLALAFVVPHNDISLVAGVMQAFTHFFDNFHFRWAIRIMAILVAVGTLAEIVTWIIEPSKGIFIAGTKGELPSYFNKLNRHGVQARILIIQGFIVTAISLIFLLMPSVSSSYWILTALTAQLYLIMYILMFISGIRLKYTKPKVKRAYTVPGGKVGMWIVGMTGIISCIGVIFVSFFPPTHVDIGSILFFELFLVIGLIVTCAIPLIINQCKKKSWVAKGSK